MTASAFVEIEDVGFRRDRRVIYDGLNATVPRGKITAIVGPSGTGKTTLLRLIGGQLKPESGDVRVDGVSVQSLKRAELFQLRKRMGMLFQSGAFGPFDERLKVRAQLAFRAPRMRAENIGGITDHRLDTAF